MADMHPLGALIADRMRRNGWSLDDVVARAAAQGEKLGRSNLHRMQKQPPESLTRSAILGLAAGLGVTPLSVANAALQSMGINPHAAEITDSIATVDIDPTLSDPDRRRLKALIVEMRGDQSQNWRPRKWRRPPSDDSGDEWTTDHMPRSGQG